MTRLVIIFSNCVNLLADDRYARGVIHVIRKQQNPNVKSPEVTQV